MAADVSRARQRLNLLSAVTMLASPIILMGTDMTSKAQSVTVDTSRPIAPLFEMRLSVPVESRQAYFTLLQEFAQDHGFQTNIKESELRRGWFTTDLIGDQVVAMGDNFKNPGVFIISFLPAISKSPPAILVTSLKIDLKRRIAHVPDLTILIER